MQITKEKVNLIPDMDYIKFEPFNGQTQITAWDKTNQFIAQFCIPEEINKPCIVNQKAIQMLSKLCSTKEPANVNVTTTFNISSSKGKYRGSIITSEFDMGVYFDETNMITYNYDSSILATATKFTSEKSRGILKGINVGESGVVSTDSYKAYCYGIPNDMVGNVTLDLKFVDRLCKRKFNEIHSVGNRIMIIDALGVKWYSTVLEGTYPKTKALFSISNRVDFDYTILKESVDLAIDSNEDIKGDSKDIKGYVDLKSDGKQIMIASENYQNTFEIECEEFDFRMSAVPLKLLNSLNVKEFHYIGEKKPIIVKMSEHEKALFLPIVGVDKR